MVYKGEAIVVILDVGISMHRDETYPTSLEESKKIISRIIHRKIFLRSKDEIALVLCGNAERDENICIAQNLQRASWKLLEIVNDIEGTDIVVDSLRELALDTAIGLLQNSRRAKIIDSRKILFFTNFDGNFKRSYVDVLKNYSIEINFIGPVVITEEMKLSRDINNGSYLRLRESHISDLLRDVNGKSYSFSDVLSTLTNYKLKTYDPSSINLTLKIGKLSIPISIFIKVRGNFPRRWSHAYAHDLGKWTRRRVTFCMNDESQTGVPFTDLIQAYKYGTTVVPYSQVDKKLMDFKSGEKGMTVLGFTKAEKVPRYLCNDFKSRYVFCQKHLPASGKMLAAFIQSLQELNMVAIVCFACTPRSVPVIGFLTPRIKENYECLVFLVLPFLEDLRHLEFTPLDSDSKNIPTEEQLNAVDELISAMDMTASHGGDDDEEEILKPKNTVNPYVQRLFQCLEYRAHNPKEPLPDIPPHIQALINPVPKLLNRAKTSVKKIKSLFPLKECVPKKLNDSKFQLSSDRVCYVDMSIKIEPLDEDVPELHVSEEFSRDPNLLDDMFDKITQVGKINPVKDIQYLINNQILPFNKICGQINDVLSELLQDSDRVRFRFPKICSIFKEYRASSLKANDCKKYNLFMISLQKDLLGTNGELWDRIRSEKIALISKEELPTSTVSSEEAEIFLSTPSPTESARSTGNNIEPSAIRYRRRRYRRVRRVRGRARKRDFTKRKKNR